MENVILSALLLVVIVGGFWLYQRTRRQTLLSLGFDEDAVNESQSVPPPPRRVASAIRLEGRKARVVSTHSPVVERFEPDFDPLSDLLAQMGQQTVDVPHSHPAPSHHHDHASSHYHHDNSSSYSHDSSSSSSYDSSSSSSYDSGGGGGFDGGSSGGGGGSD